MNINYLAIKLCTKSDKRANITIIKQYKRVIKKIIPHSSVEIVQDHEVGNHITFTLHNYVTQSSYTIINMAPLNWAQFT